MAPIEYSHFPELSEPDAGQIRALLELEMEKILRHHPLARMHVDFKVIEHKGIKAKREIHCVVSGPKIRLQVHDSSFNPVLSVKAICKKLSNELGHVERKN
jgi:hypothetical protein